MTKSTPIKPDKKTGKLYSECDGWCDPIEMATWREDIKQVEGCIPKRVRCFCNKCKEREESDDKT